MKELVKLLDKHLDYIRHEIISDTIYIYVRSNREEPACPYCGIPFSRRHSVYGRSFQNLLIIGKKKMILENRKMFCVNPKSRSHETPISSNSSMVIRYICVEDFLDEKNAVLFPQGNKIWAHRYCPSTDTFKTRRHKYVFMV